jgi:hypothetical protein
MIRRWLLTRLAVVLCVAALLYAGYAVREVMLGRQMSRQLEAAAAGMDRIEVVFGGFLDEQIPPLAVYEGRQQVKDFLGHMQIRTPDDQCRCKGDWHFLLYEAEDLTLKLSTHHGERLRWWSGEWDTDGELTKDGKAWVAELDERCRARIIELREKETPAVPE